MWTIITPNIVEWAFLTLIRRLLEVLQVYSSFTVSPLSGYNPADILGQTDGTPNRHLSTGYPQSNCPTCSVPDPTLLPHHLYQCYFQTTSVSVLAMCSFSNVTRSSGLIDRH